jgi:hypothetical protein
VKNERQRTGDSCKESRVQSKILSERPQHYRLMLVSIETNGFSGNGMEAVFAANGQLLVERGFIALTQRLVRMRMNRGV